MNAYRLQKAVQTKPKGWIKEQMEKDLSEGFLGNLDKLVPKIIHEDDIYDKDRRGGKLKKLELGLAQDENIEETQLQWWNSETQSQWHDGLIRHAYLLEDEKIINVCEKYIDKKLEAQDDDGYMGMYDKEHRYNFSEESGELWAQATLFRAFLSYYDASADEKVLNAVVRAVDVTMKNYDESRKGIFQFDQSHGLMFSDVLDKLFLLTKDEKYIYYADYLYKQLLNSEIADEMMEVDVKEVDILNKDYRLKGHGVHTYEHLRTLVTLAFNEYEDLEMKKYYENLFNKYYEKILRCISPSGGPIGDEWVNGNFADASMTGYEYCSIQELMHTYIFLLEKTGDLKWAEEIEHIIFNAGQGSRHTDDSTIAYLKSDNSYSMTGGFQYDREDIQHKANVRYKYSPTHQDAATCCVSNAGRIMPYYLQSQWLIKGRELLKATYGAGVFETQIDGVGISIEEKSDYPFRGKMTFLVKVNEEVELDIAFRIPKWCKVYKVNGDMDYRVENSKIIFSGNWRNSVELEIDFNFEFESHKDLLGDVYFSYGPLVLALPIKGKQKVVKDYELCGLRETMIEAGEEVPLNLCVSHTSLSSINTVSDKVGWKNMKFEILLTDQNDMSEKSKEFVPMGGSILRKVTFKTSV